MGRFEDLFEKDADAAADFKSDFRCDRKKRVGAYVLGRTLGEGSFAKVRLAVHLISREKVAVKVVNKKAVLKRDYARRNLHREAAMLQRLQHPNIIRLYEVMETDNHYYIVTELADGYDFMGYISERYNLGEEECRTYMRQMVSAVDHMHQAGVIHRDLKIENLMFDKDMNVKIIDFGLGNAWDGHSLLTTQCGSPAYAAPEIFSKKPYGPSVDLWSVGVNLYAMLTGNLPFTADPPNNLTKLHAAILKGCNPPSNVSKECQDVLLGLMDVNETRRMTMAELKDHPWITADQGPLEAFRPKTRPQESELDEVVLGHMVNQLGMDDATTREALLNNKVNAVTATYQLLVKRKMKGLDGLGPGYMPGEFLTQKWTTPVPLGELGTLRQGEPSVLSRGGSVVGNMSKQSNVDTNRMLQRQKMPNAVIPKSDSSSRLGSSGSRSSISHTASRPNTVQSDPPSVTTPRINSGSQASDSTHTTDTSDRSRPYKQPSMIKGAPVDNYKDCLSKLRSHRERPSRSILKSEAGKHMPIKPVTPMEMKPEAQPIIVPVVTKTPAQITTVVESGNKRDDMLQLTPRRTYSASTKSVRFNLEPDATSDDASTVVSFRSSGHPSQMERLVLRRLSADKVRRENIHSMAKIHYNKDHWEMNQEAMEALRKHSSPDSSSIVSASNATGRMRAMRVLCRPEGQQPPPAPPNSTLGRHRGVPVNSNGNVIIAHRHASANASSASGAIRGQHNQRLFQGQQHGGGGGGTAYPDKTLPNGHLIARSRQLELMEGNSSNEEHNKNQSENYRFQMRDDQGSRVLVWDLKVVEASEGNAPDNLQRASTSLNLNESPTTQHRKLGTLRGQVAMKPKPNISDMAELKNVKGIYSLPERGAVPVSSRGAGLANQNTGSSVTKTFTTSQPVKVKLRSPRGGGLFAMKDPLVMAAIKGPESPVTK